MSDLMVRQASAIVDTSKLAARIKLMIYNGKKLTDPEAEALAVYSAVNDLNPFVGECWYLPGIGPGPGIAGWRKKADEQLEYEARRAACPSARFWCDYVDPEPKETGALLAGDIAVKVILHDTITKTQWEQRVLSNYIELVKNNVKDWDAARELAGQEPVWTAVGIVRAGENFGRDAMPRYERACKRAEKAAIRKRFPRVYLPEPVGYDDVIDGQFTPDVPTETPKRSQEQNLKELGIDTSSISTPATVTHESAGEKEITLIRQSTIDAAIMGEDAIPVEHDAEPPIVPATPKWSDDLLKHLVACKLGVKDEGKLIAMLDRSTIATPETPRRFLEMYVNWYCQERKADKNEKQAADIADNRLADVIAAQAGG